MALSPISNQIKIPRRCYNDLQSMPNRSRDVRRFPGMPKEIRGTIWGVIRTSQERPKSLPGMTRERSRANRHAEKAVKERQDAQQRDQNCREVGSGSAHIEQVRVGRSQNNLGAMPRRFSGDFANRANLVSSRACRQKRSFSRSCWASTCSDEKPRKSN